jgi:UDP-N-acetylglucosamine diphosphorylase / glucose-1-phosphate thymidylyltransferase / UDP-N-acetylgalactosamine diphosphorylase / glucosamine-1-phosphate N-acetyltransferase / galactosamine-1-phosphate N-acetyltransferase
MYKYIIEDPRHVAPFNEPASLLTVGTLPLKIHQENLFAEMFPKLELRPTLQNRDELNKVQGQAIVYRDNLWFDKDFLSYFMDKARKAGRACRAAFDASDQAFKTYALPLSTCFEAGTDRTGKAIYMADLWYFPEGYTADVMPIVVPTEARQIGFYSVPDFMSMEQDRLTHFPPMRALISIESWVHVYFAAIIFGNFARASRLDHSIEQSVMLNLKLLWHAVLQQKQLLSIEHPRVLKIGKNTNIHPTAIITGPAEIGDNCSIEAGAIIDNCTIGDNVTVDTGCVLKMSTVASGCFLPFRSSLYLTQIMENTIIAQNTCLQMCVVGRNSFVGAGSTFTDFNLIGKKPIRAADIEGKIREVGQIVLGGAVGHNCRIGSGMIVFPGRMIESDVVLFASPQRRVIRDTVEFEESDHLYVKGGSEVHHRFYPRADEKREQDDVKVDTW